MNYANRPPVIMVVDDTPANLKLLEEALRKRGYEVMAYPLGRPALEAAAMNPPDLVLLDINMPELTGYETCARLKADPKLSAIPVIFISALNEMLDKAQAFQCGGVDYVTKPFQIKEVYMRVDTHLKLRALQAELESHNARLEDQVQQRTRQLADANGRLAILDKTKSDFLTLISHELRTPLNGLFGVTDLVFDAAKSDPVMSRYRQLFEESRERLLHILEDALLLSQIEIGGEKFTPRPVSLRAILQEAIRMAGAFAEARNVTIEECPDYEREVLGDPGLLAKALDALLETAVKFADSGSKVRLTIEEKPNLRLVIQAPGYPVPPEVISRFFDVLAIAETILPGGNLGLGPPVAGRIIALFGGAVTVSNLEPKGIQLVVSFVPAES